jgi:hypothetical protein
VSVRKNNYEKLIRALLVRLSAVRSGEDPTNPCFVLLFLDTEQDRTLVLPETDHDYDSNTIYGATTSR